MWLDKSVTVNNLFVFSGVKTKCEAALSQASEIDDIISCAADLINLFVQLNWTGPLVNLDEELNQLIGRGQSTSILSELNKESLDHLSWDGEVGGVGGWSWWVELL